MKGEFLLKKFPYFIKKKLTKIMLNFRIKNLKSKVLKINYQYKFLILILVNEV